jgi:serine/threonine protein kinase
VVIDPQRVIAVFMAAVELADESEREALLDRECGEDRAFRKQVNALLHPDETVSTATPEPRNLRPPVSGKDPAVLNQECQLTWNPGPEEKSGSDKSIKLDFLEPTNKPGYLGRLGHYDVIDVIGRGGFGVVLKALDDKLQRIVAIKVLPLEWALGSNAHKRFMREARAAGAIRHDNVVQVYAVEEKPVFSLVMEYIPGGSLLQRIERDGPFSLEDTLKIGSQLARGLAAAHDAGLIHRDIKPANILVENGPDLKVKITDFGLARGTKDTSLTQTGWILGTPMFMAPEQAYGYMVDHRADLFSLGSVLYTLLSGKPPFPDGTADQVMRSVTREMPTPLEELVPDAPHWFCEIIAKLHAKEPEDRIQSAREVVELMENCQAPPTNAPTPIPDQKTESIETRSEFKWWKRAAIVAAPTVLMLAVMWLSGFFKTAESDATHNPIGVSAESENKALETPHNRYTNPLKMEFALIPKGKAWLGGGAGNPGEKEIDVSVDFYMGVYEVTREEWENVMGTGKNASQFSRKGKQEAAIRTISDADLKRFPIDSISWNDCQEFVTKVNQAIVEEGWVYRLPTSMEWEYACRGGPMANRDESSFDYYLDEPTNTLPPGKANLDSSGLKRPSKVGSYPPNKLGLHDMHGNVFEYCTDIVEKENETLRLLTGGAWIDSARLCSAEHRGLGNPEAAYTGGGLRLVRVPTTGVPISVKVVER